MRLIPIIFLFILQTSAQNVESLNTLMIGNYSSLCLPDSSIHQFDSLPENLENFDIIFLFSNSTSNFSIQDVERLTDFVDKGGGLYAGSDNWPMQSQSNQLTQRIYKKQCYGDYDKVEAEATTGNLNLKELEDIPAGKTTVAFPLDYRLQVEAWVGDQPLILTGKFGQGRIIIDGGYSRFYCDAKKEESDILFERFMNYLGGN